MWLLRDGDVLAAIDARRPRWPAQLHGAMVLRGPALVQTVTSAVALDMAWCCDVEGPDVEGPDVENREARCLEVRRISTLEPRRVARPHLLGGAVVVAGRGAFERWRLQVGDRLEIR